MSSVYQVDISNDNMATWSILNETDPEKDPKCEYRILNGRITLSIDEIDSFEFDVYPNHKYWDGDVISPYKTFVRVKEINSPRANPYVFAGRVIGNSDNMDDDGSMYKNYVCESLEGLLLDVAIDTTDLFQPNNRIDPANRYITAPIWTMTLAEDNTFKVMSRWYFDEIIRKYNEQVPSTLRMTPTLYRGVIGCGISRYSSEDYSPTSRGTADGGWIYVTPTFGTVVHDLLVDLRDNDDLVLNDTENLYGPDLVLQGAIYVEYSPSGITIQMAERGLYSEDFNRLGHIDFGRNLGGLTVDTDYTDVVTVIKPLGYSYYYPVYYRGDDGVETYEREFKTGFAEYRAVLDKSDTPNIVDGILSRHGVTYDASKGTLTKTSARSKYGIIYRMLSIDDLYTPVDTDQYGPGNATIDYTSALKFVNRCVRYLNAHAKPSVSYSVTTYDLQYLSKETLNKVFNGSPPMTPGHFDLYQWWYIKNDILGISESLPVARVTIDMDNPSSSTIEFSKPTPRDSVQSAKTQKQAEQLAAENDTPYADSVSNSGQDNYIQTSERQEAESSGSGGQTPAVEAKVTVTKTQELTQNWLETLYGDEYAMPPRSIRKVRYTFFYAGLIPYFNGRRAIAANQLFDYVDNGVKSPQQALPLLFDGGNFAYKIVQAGTNADGSAWRLPTEPLGLIDIKPNHSTPPGVVLEYDWRYIWSPELGTYTGNGGTYYIAAPRIELEFTIANLSNDNYSKWPPAMMAIGNVTGSAEDIALLPAAIISSGNHDALNHLWHYVDTVAINSYPAGSLDNYVADSSDGWQTIYSRK